MLYLGWPYHSILVPDHPCCWQSQLRLTPWLPSRRRRLRCPGAYYPGRILLAEQQVLSASFQIPLHSYIGDLVSHPNAQAQQRRSGREPRNADKREAGRHCCSRWLAEHQGVPEEVPSAATMMTRERSASFTAGSRGRTRPFSTMPATATGRRCRARCASTGNGAASGASGNGASCGSEAIRSSSAWRCGLRRSGAGVVMGGSFQ